MKAYVMRWIPVGLAAIASMVLLAVAPPQPLSVSLHVGRTTLDVLDSLDVQVVAHNPSGTLQTVRFVQPIEYDIEVLDGARAIWSSVPPSPPPNVTYAPHARAFAAGPTTIVVYDWNGLATGGWCPRAGTYTIAARLLAVGNQPSATVTVKFAPPLPPGDVAGLKAGQDVTIVGKLDATREILSDASGSVRLSRRLQAAPAGVEIALRGYADDRQGAAARTFTFERWAPFGPPAQSPSPRPS
jgi:hypothetical protein